MKLRLGLCLVLGLATGFAFGLAPRSASAGLGDCSDAPYLPACDKGGTGKPGGDPGDINGKRACARCKSHCWAGTTGQVPVLRKACLDRCNDSVC
jgi:hypothetical protein